MAGGKSPWHRHGNNFSIEHLSEHHTCITCMLNPHGSVNCQVLENTMQKPSVFGGHILLKAISSKLLCQTKIKCSSRY